MTYYIDYRSEFNKNVLLRIRNRLFFTFEFIRIDNNKGVIYINKKYINKRACKKIENFLLKNNCDSISNNTLLANGIKNKYPCEVTNSFNNKNIMKAMIIKVLRYIENCVGVDFRNENIAIAIRRNDCSNEMISDISSMFKSINIVTTKIGNMRRLENRMQKEDIVLSVSNSKRKALKRAKILINVDFDNKVLNEFEINRNCIIINLNECNIELSQRFQGCIINNICVDFANRYKQIERMNYKYEDLYNSFLHNLSYVEASKCVIEDNCKITHLVGCRGIITKDELMNNYTNSVIKLDKSRKKD